MHTRNHLHMVAEHGRQADCAAWRIIASTKQNEMTKGNEQQAAYAREYAVIVESELQKISDGILALMDKNLIPSESAGEPKVFYYKMKSNFYRYFAECATGDTKSKAAEDARVAYAEATKVFQNPDEACKMARVPFEKVRKTVEVPQVQ